ncbi:MAG: hypothetical protein QOE35_2577 [Actinomycetota bacterium]|jgi:hypothetical protein
MQPMRDPQSEAVVDLDPALLADPGTVIAMSGQRRAPRPRTGRSPRPPGRRVFTHAGPVDPAYLGRERSDVQPMFAPTRGPSARTAVQIALVVLVGSGLGVLVAGIPH